MKGNVKFFNEMKGFGFIAGEDDQEYFVHVSSIIEGVQLTDNMEVEFNDEQTDRGLAAKDVRLADSKEF